MTEAFEEKEEYKKTFDTIEDIVTETVEEKEEHKETLATSGEIVTDINKGFVGLCLDDKEEDVDGGTTVFDIKD